MAQLRSHAHVWLGRRGTSPRRGSILVVTVAILAVVTVVSVLVLTRAAAEVRDAMQSSDTANARTLAEAARLDVERKLEAAPWFFQSSLLSSEVSELATGHGYLERPRVCAAGGTAVDTAAIAAARASYQAKPAGSALPLVGEAADATKARGCASGDGQGWTYPSAAAQTGWDLLNVPVHLELAPPAVAGSGTLALRVLATVGRAQFGEVVTYRLGASSSWTVVSTAPVLHLEAAGVDVNGAAEFEDAALDSALALQAGQDGTAPTVAVAGTAVGDPDSLPAGTQVQALAAASRVGGAWDLDSTGAFFVARPGAPLRQGQLASIVNSAFTRACQRSGSMPRMLSGRGPDFTCLAPGATLLTSRGRAVTLPWDAAAFFVELLPYTSGVQTVRLYYYSPATLSAGVSVPGYSFPAWPLPAARLEYDLARDRECLALCDFGSQYAARIGGSAPFVGRLPWQSASPWIKAVPAGDGTDDQFAVPVTGLIGASADTFVGTQLVQASDYANPAPLSIVSGDASAPADIWVATALPAPAGDNPLGLIASRSVVTPWWLWSATPNEHSEVTLHARLLGLGAGGIDGEGLRSSPSMVAGVSAQGGGAVAGVTRPGRLTIEGTVWSSNTSWPNWAREIVVAPDAMAGTWAGVSSAVAGWTPASVSQMTALAACGLKFCSGF